MLQVSHGSFGSEEEKAFVVSGLAQRYKNVARDLVHDLKSIPSNVAQDPMYDEWLSGALDGWVPRLKEAYEYERNLQKLIEDALEEERSTAVAR